MNKQTILLDEHLYHKTLRNGLRVYLHPKKDFIDYHVSLQVGMGGESIDYFLGDESYSLPAGTAHFLEHVYFENNNINISDVFASYNADINASTSRDLTQYYFSAQDQFEDVLRLFLNHFAKVDISQRTIEKERAIIIKEIKMYEDNLFYQVHDALIKQMYKDKKIWKDIAGTEDTVKQINRQVIEQAIRHFYQPNNMVLIITGPFDPDSIMTLVEKSPLNQLHSLAFKPRLLYDVDGELDHHIYQVNPKQSVNYMTLGVKIDISTFDHLSTSQKRLAMIMFFEYYFSESSQNYQLLKDEKLINYSYYTTIRITDTYGYFILASESKKPLKLKQRVMTMLNHLKPINKRLFEASKRSRIGHFIGYFDNAHSVNSALADLIKKDIEINRYMGHVSDISLRDLERTQTSFKDKQIYSVIYAKKA